MYTHILIATDGSSLASRGVEHGVRLAKALSASVTLLTVSERFHTFSLEPTQLEETLSSFREHMSKEVSKVLADARRLAAAAGVETTALHKENDEPYQAIIRTAEGKGCDLIVMASHGRGGVSAMFLGSETLKVLSHSKLPVLVIR
ncbi:universal stress protein [Microvirga terrestris]|uniref:Universal stress protein n=1 Tax=Microvirga terrestris TaxID=2791024 RepID=A0ABS0HTY9_9HYPH|nr:universal stress protein [Microvirga terrestris]MBF9196954.1 universal stress protein [Microvirga terrestris]